MSTKKAQYKRTQAQSPCCCWFIRCKDVREENVCEFLDQVGRRLLVVCQSFWMSIIAEHTQTCNI